MTPLNSVDLLIGSMTIPEISTALGGRLFAYHRQRRRMSPVDRFNGDVGALAALAAA